MGVLTYLVYVRHHVTKVTSLADGKGWPSGKSGCKVGREEETGDDKSVGMHYLLWEGRVVEVVVMMQNEKR